MTNTDVQDEIINHIKRNEGFFSGVIQRSIVMRSKSGLKNIHSMFYCVPKNQILDCRSKLEFPPFEFSEEFITLDELKKRLIEINNGKLQVGAEMIALPNISFSQHTFQPANNLFGKFAGLEYHIVYNEPEGDIYRLPDRFIGFDTPHYFVNRDHAVRVWFCLKVDRSPFSSAGFLSLQKIHIFIPTCAYIENMRVEDNSILFYIVNQTKKDLRLRGYIWHTSNTGTPFNLPVTDGVVRLSIKDDVENMELQLVASGGELVDHVYVYDFLPGRRFADVFAKKITRNKILELIQQAENDVCEIKPFFPPRAGHPICRKIGETLVGFANKNGGDIIIGVDDYLEIEDFSKLRDIMKDLGKPRGTDIEILENFCILLKKELRDHVLDADSDLRYYITPIEIAGKPIVKIEVERGNKIHQTRDGAVWCRRNSRTVRPNAKELQEMYQKFEQRI